MAPFLTAMLTKSRGNPRYFRETHEKKNFSEQSWIKKEITMIANMQNSESTNYWGNVTH